MHLLHTYKFRLHPSAVFITVSRFFEYFFQRSHLFRGFEKSGDGVADVTPGLSFSIAAARYVQFGNMGYESESIPKDAHCKSQIFHDYSQTCVWYLRAFRYGSASLLTGTEVRRSQSDHGDS